MSVVSNWFFEDRVNNIYAHSSDDEHINVVYKGMLNKQGLANDEKGRFVTVLGTKEKGWPIPYANKSQEMDQETIKATALLAKKILDESTQYLKEESSFSIEIYEGMIVDGKYHGEGTQTRLNEEYKGKFCNGKRHGQGTLRFKHGASYEGKFYQDGFYGDGTLKVLCGAELKIKSRIMENVRKLNFGPYPRPDLNLINELIIRRTDLEHFGGPRP